MLETHASTAMRKYLVRFKTYEKCTKAFVIYHQQHLILKRSQIKYFREERLYIPQKEIEKLENNYKTVELTNVNFLKSFLFSNMATVV